MRFDRLFVQNKDSYVCMRCKIYLNVPTERNSLRPKQNFFFLMKKKITLFILIYSHLSLFLLLAEFKYKFTWMVRMMKSITLDTTHNFTQFTFVRYTLSWKERQSENEALCVTILVTRLNVGRYNRCNKNLWTFHFYLFNPIIYLFYLIILLCNQK